MQKTLATYGNGLIAFCEVDWTGPKPPVFMQSLHGSRPTEADFTVAIVLVAVPWLLVLFLSEFAESLSRVRYAQKIACCNTFDAVLTGALACCSNNYTLV